MRRLPISWLPPLVAGLLSLPAACGDEPESASVAIVADSAAPDSGLPVSTGAVSTNVDVTVAGRVVDDETGEGVPGGYVIVLAPGVSFEEWEGSSDEEVEELMAGAAVTDSLGRYEVPDLPRGLDFTVVVAARGHTPAIFESGLSVRPDDPPVTRIADVRLEPR
ncbi:MAG TPA: carboxypeptidase-like regulatory domain-containing protein [Gemmatimonadota bacterium]|nr:carboxypeptidase-like regulatory domain-containing protein [Gemmatimonadota bacterium]